MIFLSHTRRPFTLPKDCMKSCNWRRTVISTERFIIIGTSWFATRICNTLLNVNLSCCRLLMKRDIQIILTIYQLLHIVISIGIISFFLHCHHVKFNNKYLLLTLCIADIVFMTITGILNVVKLCRILAYKEKLDKIDLMCILMLFFVVIITLYLVFVMFVNEIYTGWFLLLGLFNIGLIENINMFLWILLFPIILIIFVVEAIIRLLRGELKCLRKERIVLKLNYKLHSYDQYTETKCPICLVSLEHKDLYCLLSCQHMYHEHCILTWIIKQNSCPICREDIVFS